MRRLTPALGMIIALAVGASMASAQVVQLSGHTFHKAVCPGPAAPGRARCHAGVTAGSSSASGSPMYRR